MRYRNTYLCICAVEALVFTQTFVRGPTTALLHIIIMNENDVDMKRAFTEHKLSVTCLLLLNGDVHPMAMHPDQLGGND